MAIDANITTEITNENNLANKREQDDKQAILDKKNEADFVEIKYYLWWSVVGAVGIGVFMIFLISVFGYIRFKDGINAFGSGVLIAGVTILSGGFLGFMFGIPSILQNPEARLKYNDNLVQISDWLTKIIVGVGLTQLYKIPHFVNRIGTQFQDNFESQVVEPLYARNIAISIMGYYFILGFIMIYFWTKTDYSTVMKYMDDAFNKKLREETMAKESALQQVEQKDEQLKVVNEQKDQTTEQLETVKKDSVIKDKEIQAVFQTFSPNAEDIKNQLLETRASPDLENDPQKGKWGGKAESNGRKLDANVRESSIKDWFSLSLDVVSTDNNKPLEGDVIFHLHPSLPAIDQTIKAENGIASLQLLVYGAFTVGVECDNGQTQLEIDLAEIPNVPQLFKER